MNSEWVNAKPVNDKTTLLDWLRHRGNSETKRSCEEGSCGACNVLIKRTDDFESVPSCCLRLGSLHNAQVLTGKAIEDSKVGKEIAKSFQKNFASQCGFCTAGFAIQACTKKSTTNVINHLGGNYCRCTGYRIWFS